MFYFTSGMMSHCCKYTDCASAVQSNLNTSMCPVALEAIQLSKYPLIEITTHPVCVPRGLTVHVRTFLSLGAFSTCILQEELHAVAQVGQLYREGLLQAEACHLGMH